MSNWSRVVFASVVFLFAIAGWGTALAADPDKADITLVAHEGPPGCEVPAGEFLISNSSSEYYYRVAVTATMQNDDNGAGSCENDPPNCSGDQCECDLSDTFEVPKSVTASAFGGCSLPSCGVDCDPECGGNGDCDPILHCVCIAGTYQVTHYSNDDGENWTPMPPAYPTVITQKDHHEDGLSPI